MLHITQKRTWSAGALALVFVAGIVALVVASQSTDATSAPIEPPASKFSALQPATPAAMDAVSEEMKMRLDLMALRLGLPDAGAVSEVAVVPRSDGGDVTLAAMGESICAFLTEGIGGCDEGQRVIAGQSFSAEPVGCDGYRVLGVVPDGVAHIAIDGHGDGSVDATLPVESNVYVGVLDPVRTIAMGISESGDSRFSVDLPLDYYASTNEACQ
ncbi:MAG TPA: hypothetical protein VFM51_03365 [Solirubrobacterales bacterium]|nr:hypothetical protein [Solirubrobacterales bacterium]